ncbi:MAG: hypothetical protein Q8P18_28015 [Pseudomonadota bacterium]|nr:hypothetical protein [Pseudomonadota bacterium]
MAATARGAYLDNECDTSCVYVPSVSVMLLYCDTRGEYIGFLDGGPEAENPCPA